MAIRMKKISLNRIFILAVMLILAAGLCACGKKDDGADISSEETYDVLSVDSVEGNGIDYGKYEISGGGYNDAGENDNGDGNISGSDKSNGISDSEDDGDNDGNGSVSKKENNDGDSSAGKKDNDGGSGSAGKKDNDGDKSGDSEKNDSSKNNGAGSNNGDAKKSDKSSDSQNQNSVNQTENNNANTNPAGSKTEDSGVPAPSEPQDVVIDKSKVYKCSLFVECKEILADIEKLDEKKRGLVPKDGVILDKKDIEFCDGESAFDVLLRETRNEKIHMEYSFTPIYNSSYIEGIANLYEFDCGELSGWVYSVNDLSPSYGISRYSLKDGDVIHVGYTLERK